MHLPYPPYITYQTANWPWYTPIWRISRRLKRQSAKQAMRAVNKLYSAGLSSVSVMRPESHYLELELMDNEHIKALVQGYHEDNRVILAATNKRVLAAERKPHFVKSRELDYQSIYDIGYADNQLFAEITLQTQFGDFVVKGIKLQAARRFREYISQRCLRARDAMGVHHDHTVQKRYV